MFLGLSPATEYQPGVVSDMRSNYAYTRLVVFHLLILQKTHQSCVWVYIDCW